MDIFKYRSRRWSAPPFLEVLIVVVLMVVVFGVNTTIARSFSTPFNHPYQVLLPLVYPAVFFAAGHGLSTADVNQVPGLPEFVYGESPSFDIDTIPEDIVLAPIASPVAVSHYYYLYLVGWIWRIFGVSLDSLVLLSILFRVICACLLYLLFRVFLGRLGSIVGVLIVCCSTAMLHTGMSIRDFSKTPFLLGVFLLLSYLATRRSSRRRVLCLSSLLGLVIGVGMGFRQDLLISVPPVIVTLLLVIRIKGENGFSARILSVFLFFVFLSVAAYPIVKGTSAEGNQTMVHSLLLGVSPGMEAELGFGEASYELMPSVFVGDSANLAAVNVYARRKGNLESMVNTESAEYRRYNGDESAHLFIDPYLMFNGKVYARFGAQLFKDMIVSFPGDFVSRAWCAVTAVFKMPAQIHERVLGALAHRPPGWLDTLLSVQEIVFRHVAKWGLLYTLLLFLLVSGKNLVLALFFTGMLAWFTGYTSILYEYRHSFYLVFIPVLSGLICIRLAWRAACHIARGRSFRNSAESVATPYWWRRPLINAGAYVLALVGVIAVPVYVLRLWQESQVNGLADKILSARMTPVLLEDNSENELTRVWPREKLPQLKKAAGLPPGETAWEYLAVVFETHGHDIPVKIQYNAERVLNDLSQEIMIRGVEDGHEGRTTFFFPVYETCTSDNPDLWRDFLRTYPVFKTKIGSIAVEPPNEWWLRGEFEGISFPKEYQQFFVGMFSVSEIEEVAMLPLMQVPDDRRHFRQFKTCKNERFWRSLLAGRQKIKDIAEPEEIPASCWDLDEGVLAPPVSTTIAQPHFRGVSAESYSAQWNTRITYYPGIAKAAALDMATAGTVWLQEGHLDEARKAYEAACKFDPENAIYAVRLGQVYLREGDRERALRSFQDAFRIQPLLPQTADKVDEIIAETGNMENREAFWREVVGAHPESWFAGMRLGGVLESAGKWEDAVNIYETVHALNPGHPDTCLALARCLGRTGRVTEAFLLLWETAQDYEAYRVLAADHLASLAGFLEERQNYDLAEDALLRALGIVPENGVYYMRLGDIRRIKGKTQEAIDVYQQGLRIADLKDTELRDALSARIRQLETNYTVLEDESVPDP